MSGGARIGDRAAKAKAHIEVDLRPGRDRDVDAVRVDGPMAAVGVRQDVDARPHARQLQAHHLVHVPAAQQLRSASFSYTHDANKHKEAHMARMHVMPLRCKQR